MNEDDYSTTDNDEMSADAEVNESISYVKRLYEKLISSQVDILLIIISAVGSILANLLSINTSDLFINLSPIYLTLLYLSIALLIVIMVGTVVYRNQNRRKNRILADLRKTEYDLFSKLEKNIPELLGIGGTDE